MSEAIARERTVLIHVKASPIELMQERMMRQMVQRKEAYSHIQARTGDTKSDSAVSAIV